ncbi:MAG: response regulator transcription factor [Treponema sp.]|jgi:two-component system response regulator RegX3|nr:response regulator transcription factor [Treponema sp.]
MQGNILIIEDVKELADLVSLYLSREGFHVRIAESAEGAFAIIDEWTPDLVILDINLPGMDGFEFLQKFRRVSDTPVMVVSARDSDEDQISGLGIGADEYITKPFSPKVLVVRVRALFRRLRMYTISDASASQGKTDEHLFRFGPFVLDYDAYLLKKGDMRIPLSAKEYGCLVFLTEHSGKAMNVESIYNGVWKNNFGDLTTVAVYIQRLRKKIEDDPSEPVYIETVHGMGYRFNSA